MLSTDRPKPTVDDGVFEDTKPPCVALVPLTPAVRWSGVPARPLSRADFIAQLIATAEQAPQTRLLRRATPADAQHAYRASQPHPGSGLRTRQVA